MVHREEVDLEAVGVSEGLRAERAEEQPRAGRPQRGHCGLAKLLGQRHGLQLGEGVQGAAATAVHTGGYLGEAAGVVQLVGDDSPSITLEALIRGFY